MECHPEMSDLNRFFTDITDGVYPQNPNIVYKVPDDLAQHAVHDTTNNTLQRIPAPSETTPSAQFIQPGSGGDLSKNKKKRGRKSNAEKEDGDRLPKEPRKIGAKKTKDKKSNVVPWYVSINEANSKKKREIKRRKLRITDPVEPSSKRFREGWSVEEKELLLSAMSTHGNNLDAIVPLIPSRSRDDIRGFIERIRLRAKSETRSKLKAPIEQWLNKAEDLTHCEEDFSQVIGQTLGIAANLEPHYRPRHELQPNYTKIYRFLVAQIKSVDEPDLSACDARVVLDMIQALSDCLSKYDYRKQRDLMIKKYQLLTKHVRIDNKRESYENVRRALEEDLLEPEAAAEDGNGGSTRAAATSADVRPRRGNLYTLNPFCIPVKYLKPADKEEIVVRYRTTEKDPVPADREKSTSDTTIAT